MGPQAQQDVRDWAVSMVHQQPSADGGGVANQLYRLCRAVAAGLHLKGTAVTVKSLDGFEAVAAASDATSGRLAELEFSVGEGPSHDAFVQGRPVIVSELSGHKGGGWPGYTPLAQDEGLGAVFAFPLQLGASRFGVLSLFADTPRRLDRGEMARCLAMSELATEMLLDSSASSPDGEIDPDLKSALSFRSEIYQAQGMVMAALRIQLPEALARMRAHAFASGRHLIDVSADIVEGRLQLTKDGQDL